MSELKADGVIKFTADDTEIALAEEDLLIEVAKMDGYVTEGDNYVTVVIDTTLTPELIEEGYVREVISKIQTMRKDSDFQVTDRIKVYVTGNAKNADEIKRVVLGDAFVMDAACDNSKEWNINGEKVTIGVEVSK